MFDPDARLDSGMKATEAVAKAAKWWNEYRGALRQTFNLEQAAPAVRQAIRQKSGLGAPAMIVKGDITETIPDGILSGKPWSELTVEEQAKIVKVWHYNHVVVPQQPSADILDMTRLGQGSIAKTEKASTPHKGKPESTPRCSTKDSS